MIGNQFIKAYVNLGLGGFSSIIKPFHLYRYNPGNDVPSMVFSQELKRG